MSAITGGNNVPGPVRTIYTLPIPLAGKRNGGAGMWRAVLALSLDQFNALVEEHAPALYRIAYRMIGDRHEAEDMVQEAFRSAWKSRAAYESGRGDRAWLASILRRRVVDRWRRITLPTVTIGDAAPEHGIPGEDPLAADYTDQMQLALAQLPAELRETLLLVVVGELTHQEVADLLEIPLGTVLSRVSRARRRLRDLLVSAGT
jgi:RNA polymerase sigma-70 factor, ECF subfamily